MTLTEEMYRARYLMDIAEVAWLQKPTTLRKKLLEKHIAFYKNLIKNQ